MYVRCGKAIESLEVRALLAADLFADSDVSDIENTRSSSIPDPTPEFGPTLFLLEGESISTSLEGEEVVPTPVNLYFSVVTDPTQFADPDLGSVEQLPESMLRTHEWDRYFVEVWIESGEQVGDLSVDLNYQTEIATPRNITFGPAFVDGDFELNDDMGELRNIAAHAASDAETPPPAGGLVLFARIEFGADSIRDNVKLDFATGTVGPHSLQLDMVRSSGENAAGEMLEVHSAEQPDFGLVPVIYDLNDDQTISLVDLSLMIRALGTATPAADGTADWYADVNKDYVVSLIDLSYMIRNIGVNWSMGDVKFPSNYPEAWIAQTTTGGDGGVGGGGSDGGDGGDGGDENQDPPLRFVPFDVGGNALAPDPAMLQALQALLQIEIVFPVGFDFTLMQGYVSYSDGDGDGDKETMLEIEVDDQLFETEIEIEIMTDLIDTDELWAEWAGTIGSYFGDVMSELKDLFLSSDEE